jgi:hypothetical protein
VPPASDTVSREGSKPNAETPLCGSVHESPVRFTGRAIAVTRMAVLRHVVALRLRWGEDAPRATS